MNRSLIQIFFLFGFLLHAQDGNAESSSGGVSINIPSGIEIEVSGKAEVEFIDVEGKGGARYEDDFLKKIETRSPYTQIDKTVLNFKLLYTDNITYNFSLRFDDEGAYADKHFLKYVKGNNRIELGKNRPRIALKRDTEGYPLIGTAFWKGRQYHLDMEKTLKQASFGGSISLKRPIGYDDAAEDRSFRMMVYDDAEKLDGQTVEFGLRSSYSLSPLKLEAWYYFGKLIDDEDWKKRLHYDFDYYANIEADDVLNENANIGHFWFGGRAEMSLVGTLIRAEYIFSEDGYLPRDGFYIEGSRKFNVLSIKNIFGLIRYGELRVDPYRLSDSFLNPYGEMYDSALFDNDDLDDERFYPLLKDPQTWDRTLITLALGYEITSYAKLKLEYYILDEKTGDSEAKAAEQNRNYQPSVDDDQLLLQLELNF